MKKLRLINRMTISAWMGKFVIRSLNDIDEAAIIEKQLFDPSPSNFVGDEFYVQKQNVQNLWNPKIPYCHPRALFRFAVCNQRVMRLLQRGLILLHLGRWTESLAMSFYPQLRCSCS